MHLAFDCATGQLEAAARQRKERSDQALLSEPLEIGQNVFLLDCAVLGCSKIKDAWSPIPNQVVRVPEPGEVVYSVAPVHDLTRVRNVHRTMMKTTFPPALEVWPAGSSEGVYKANEGEDEGLWVVLREAAHDLPCSVQRSFSTSGYPTPHGSSDIDSFPCAKGGIQ